MRKGEQTRAAIVEAALELAARDGLEGLTIGPLAERMADVQERCLRALRVARGSADRGAQGLRAALRRRSAGAESAGETRAAAAARDLRSLARPHRDRGGARLHLGLRCRPSTTTGPARCARNSSRWCARGSASSRARSSRRSTPAICRADPTPAELVFELYGVILVLHHDARLLDSPDAWAVPDAHSIDCSTAIAAARPRARPGLAGPPNNRTNVDPLTSTPNRSTKDHAMTQYSPPLRDMQFVLHELLDVGKHFRRSADVMPRSIAS